MIANSLFSLLDFSGVAAGAFGGALEAKRHPDYKFDFVGVLGLAMISALGGGVARDILIQHGPPLALLDVRYLLVALAGGLVGLLARLPTGSPLAKLLLVVDAAALGLFAVAGATRALDAGLSFLPALLLGITTAVGGGSLRDVFSGRAPRIFERGELHAIVALLSALVFLVAQQAGLTRTLATSLGLATGFTVRILALRFRWRTKAAAEIEPAK
jgi:uncharacterized membrane protein YeiH